MVVVEVKALSTRTTITCLLRSHILLPKFFSVGTLKCNDKLFLEISKYMVFNMFPASTKCVHLVQHMKE